MERDFGKSLLGKGKKVKRIQLLFIFDRFDLKKPHVLWI